MFTACALWYSVKSSLVACGIVARTDAVSSGMTRTGSFRWIQQEGSLQYYRNLKHNHFEEINSGHVTNKYNKDIFNAKTIKMLSQLNLVCAKRICLMLR